MGRLQFNHAYPATAATFTSFVSVGHLLVVAVSYSSVAIDPSTVTVSDSLGNSYTHIPVTPSQVNQTQGALFYTVVTTGGSCTVTATASGLNAADPGLTVVEYSGISTTPTVTGYSSTVQSTSPQVSVSATAGDLIFVMYANELEDILGSPTAGFSLIQADHNHVDAQADFFNVPTTTSYIAGFSQTTSDFNTLIIAADFTPSLGFTTSTSSTSTSTSSTSTSSTSTSSSTSQSTSTSTTQSFTTSTSSTSSSTSISSTSSSISSTSTSMSTTTIIDTTIILKCGNDIVWEGRKTKDTKDFIFAYAPVTIDIPSNNADVTVYYSPPGKNIPPNAPTPPSYKYRTSDSRRNGAAVSGFESVFSHFSGTIRNAPVCPAGSVITNVSINIAP